MPYIKRLQRMILKIKKEKKFQRVDWTKRPLSLAQLNYAVKDTAYLLKLKDWLVGKLKKKNRLVWIKQEMDNLDDLELLYKSLSLYHNHYSLHTSDQVAFWQL